MIHFLCFAEQKYFIIPKKLSLSSDKFKLKFKKKNKEIDGIILYSGLNILFIIFNFEKIY